MEVEEEGEESDEEQEDDQALVQRHDVPIPEETHNKKSFFKQHKVDSRLSYFTQLFYCRSIFSRPMPFCAEGAKRHY